MTAKKCNNFTMKNTDLFLTILFCLFFNFVFAQSGTEGGISWSISDITLTINGTGETPDYTEWQIPIPWISYRPYIRHVIIGDGISSISRKLGLFNLGLLNSVTISNSVNIIEDFAFDSSWMLSSVEIPNSVTHIGFRAFAQTRLTSVTIPNSVITIADRAFQGCHHLTSVNIPNSVISIGNLAFFHCSRLTYVKIPASVTHIGTNTFSANYNLREINVDADNPMFTATDGILFNKDHTVLMTFPGSKTNNNYHIPATVTTIGAGGFMANLNLTSVTIPSSVTNIEIDAFAGCRSLREIINHATTPQIIDEYVFGMEMFLFTDVENLVLRVPAASIEAYKAAEGWKDFGKIVAIE